MRILTCCTTQAKNSALAGQTVGRRERHNVTDAGVIPVCAKKEYMAAHGRACPYADPAGVALALEEDAADAANRARRYANSENMSPVPGLTQTPRTPLHSIPLNPSIYDTSTQTPLKRAKTSSLESIPGTSDSSGTLYYQNDSHPPPWNASRQKEFSEDLCKLFIMCNIAWNVAENAQLHLFFHKWVPGAVIPDRRKLSGTYLDEAADQVRSETVKKVQGSLGTGQSDGWKNVAKTSVVASMMSVNGEVCPHILLLIFLTNNLSRHTSSALMI